MSGYLPSGLLVLRDYYDVHGGRLGSALMPQLPEMVLVPPPSDDEHLIDPRQQLAQRVQVLLGKFKIADGFVLGRDCYGWEKHRLSNNELVPEPYLVLAG
jgi:hypothetical protein